ncbi:MAG TPA: helix-hairpin-helix domain-containing protein [Kiritimatiellia bacterium]|jgi:3-methyladenine DNA glycosylase/8-oxoguanine DNA glycosylase|nr:pathogenicity locus [Lentisphaerota bacterium]HOU22566.1 helix-hairpin-helix domain-containing protein [Kiritimatiellia bacterium]HQQ60451.1 helix-hairpin-helix domain-containing protein [Kiritimatiellia bacterium]
MPENGGIKSAATTPARIMNSTTDELQTIPGVGKRTADDFRRIGIRRVQDLRNKDPEQLYARLCRRVGKPVDRCMLYVFRCAVYYATRKKPDPEKLKWWNWKDR